VDDLLDTLIDALRLARDLHDRERVGS